MKKILITCTDVIMFQFLLPHALYLISKGYLVDVACSSPEEYKKEMYMDYIRQSLPKECNIYNISAKRSLFSLQNIKAYKQIKNIINSSTYDIIWANEPVMGVITRLAAFGVRRKGKTKVLYLVQGYHFFKGAPLKSWIHYPVEKFMSQFCDCMCMVNWEDYFFTRKNMPKTHVEHIDGIGFDANKFKNADINKDAKRAELGISTDDILIVSVGELQTRKNHELVIRALAKLNNPKLKYIICGRGELLFHLTKLCNELKISDRVQFLGHRHDINEILKASDIFAYPSQKEGLGIAALEAMAAGLPMITSNIQVIKDFVVNGKNGYCFSPKDVDGYAEALKTLVENKDLRVSIGKHNTTAVEKYNLKNSLNEVESIINCI